MSNESDADIREYERELQDGQNIDYSIEKDPNEEEVVFEDEEELDRKLPKKERLIQTLERMRPYCADMVPTNNKLRKTKIKDLERLLARCLSVTSGLKMKDEFNEPETPKPTPGAAVTETVTNISSSRSGAETLYMANIGIISVIEQLSRQTKEYTGLEVAGWSDDVKRDKEQLVSILEAIYLENSEMVKTYMSPTSVWALYMLSSGATHIKPAKPT